MTPSTIGLSIIAGGILYMLMTYQQQPEMVIYGPPEETDPPAEGTDQTTGIMEAVGVAFSTALDSGVTVDSDTAGQNLRAFLDMIAYAEGTSGPDGYRTLFGGGTFDSFADHPRRLFSFTNSKGQQLKTSAAGRYQFLARTWDELRNKLGLHDFGPDNQDLGAIELIRQRGALADAQSGRLVEAVRKCSPVWASLPGAGYNQPERKINQLAAAFADAGGTLEA